MFIPEKENTKPCIVLKVKKTQTGRHYKYFLMKNALQGNAYEIFHPSSPSAKDRLKMN